MRKLSLALFILFMSVSAFAGNHDKLLGDWSFNVEKFKETKEYKEAVKDPKAGQMMQFMLGMMSKMNFTFTKTEAIAKMPKPDGTQQEDKAKYTIVADSGNTLEIKTEADKGGKAEIMVITFLDAKNIKMSPKGENNDPIKAFYLKKK